jgi:hypothetical protein
VKIKRRFVKHSIRTQTKLDIRSHYIYDWETPLFWGSVDGPAVANAQRANAKYMNSRKYHRASVRSKELYQRFKQLAKQIKLP